MSDNDLIRRGDALEILDNEGWLGNSRKFIAALPAVLIRPDYFAMAMQDDDLAALEPAPAPDYRLAPHLQRIAELAKTAPQWDTVNDRMAALDDLAHLGQEWDATPVIPKGEAP